MTIDFYGMLGSPPCRSVMMVAKALGVTLNFKEVNLAKGEHLKPEFIMINPQHTIPTLVDDGFVLTESRAIICYLMEQYGKDDSLYPKDPKKRAVVNQRLYFDMGTLYQRFGDYFYPLLHGGTLNDEKKVKVEEGIGFLEKFLESSKYAAGDHITIADYSIATSISTFEVAGFDLSKYPNINKWFNSVKQSLSGYEEINQQGINIMKTFLALKK